MTPTPVGHFRSTFLPGELMDDVSTVDHADITDIQVESGRNRASAYPMAVPNGPIGTWYDITGGEVANAYVAPAVGDVAGPVLSFSVDFAKVVQLARCDGQITVAPSGNRTRLLTILQLTLMTICSGRLAPLIWAHRYTSGLVLSLCEADCRCRRRRAGRNSLSSRPRGSLRVKDPGELPGRQFTLTIHNYRPAERL